MSVCTWTDGDTFLTETGDGVFTMHVGQKKGLPFDGQSFMLDTQATLAKMHELVGMGYDVPDWAIDTISKYLSEDCATKEGDMVSLTMSVAKAKWLVEALDTTVRDANGWVEVMADDDDELPFYLDLKKHAVEFRAALIPLIEENVI